MTLNQAVKKIIGMIPEGETRIMVAERDTHPDWAVDIQQLWINKDGSFLWRYASGCSCWSGEWSEDHIATMKEFVVDVGDRTHWSDAVIKFAETGESQDL